MPATIRQSDYDHHDNCEKKVYVHWVNRNLFSKESLNLYIPLNPSGEAVFDQVNDGVIFCEVINEIFPNSIDLTVLAVGSQTPKEEKMKNLQLAFETARSYGCQIDNLRVNDVFSGVRQSILELFWQIFYVGLVVPINYENFPEIEVLRENNEARNVIHEMKPEEILIRFVNNQIRSCNPFAKVMRSFKENLSDGQIYTILVDSIAQQHGIALKHFSSVVLKEKNERLRFEMLFENFDYLKVQGFIIEELMNSQCSDPACYKMHLLTMAIFFHRFGISSAQGAPTPVSQNEKKQEKIRKETNIEKLCRIFLNFISVKPIVTNLRADCKDGLIFAQVMKSFSPDIFRKDDFIEEFNDEQVESKRIHNAAIIINRFSKFQSIPINDFHAECIQNGNGKVICGVLYNLMLYWATNVTKSNDDITSQTERKFNERDLILWINSLSDEYKIFSFRDSQIHEKHIFAKVIDILFPNSINWSYLKGLPNRLDRVVYFVNIARREGYPMFIHPNMIASGDYRSVMLAFTILKEKKPRTRNKICPD